MITGGCTAAKSPPPRDSGPARVATVTIDSPRTAERKIEVAYEGWRGTRHRLGGSDHSGIDCSAFVQAVYRDQFGIRLPRTTTQLRRVGHEVASDDLAAGDLLFFRPDTYPRHVGIYLGNGRFVHVSARKGVMISRIDTGYWSQHFTTARRILRYASR